MEHHRASLNIIEHHTLAAMLKISKSVGGLKSLKFLLFLRIETSLTLSSPDWWVRKSCWLWQAQSWRCARQRCQPTTSSSHRYPAPSWMWGMWQIWTDRSLTCIPNTSSPATLSLTVTSNPTSRTRTPPSVAPSSSSPSSSLSSSSLLSALASGHTSPSSSGTCLNRGWSSPYRQSW